MSNDKQDNNSSNNNSAVDDTVMEEVTEARAAKKQGSNWFSLVVLGLLVGGGYASWYYQAMWMPQAKQLWARYMPAQGTVDPMAAPALRGGEVTQADNASTSSGYVLSAIPDKAPVTEVVNDVPADSTPVSEAVAPATPAQPPVVEDKVQAADVPAALATAAANDVANDVANDIVVDAMPEASAESVAPTESDAVEPVAAISMAPKVSGVTVPASIAPARQAFWRRDLVEAERLYRDYLKQQPTAADAWGELGNIYYAQAKWQQAAEAYAEAAIQLLDKGQYSQAMYLHYVVRGLDSTQVARIDAKLYAMQAAPQGQ